MTLIVCVLAVLRLVCVESFVRLTLFVVRCATYLCVCVRAAHDMFAD